MRSSVILSSLVLLLLAACGDSMGTVRIVAGGQAGQEMTQALTAETIQELGARSAEDFDAILLNVVAVRLRMKDTAADDGWHELLLEEDLPFTLDLRRLFEGELIQLAEGEIPAGTITELRFVLDSKDPGYAIPAGGEDPADRVALRVPSGTTSGLKIKGPGIEVPAGATRDLRVDFDVDASLRDEKDGIRIRPVVRYSNVTVETDDRTEPEVH